MQLKANVHMHTNDDPADLVSYSLFDAVDYAAAHDFEVLAITCHHVVAWTEEYASYAAKRGIILLSGVELSIGEKMGDRGRHVLLLGITREVEGITTFEQLATYRRENPDVVVIAPHPFFFGNFSLHGLLEKYLVLFDAIEHSWFYSRMIDRNKPAIALAKRYEVPLIATSDTHFLNGMEDNYSMLTVTEKTPKAVLQAIQNGAITMHTRPQRFFTGMLIPQSIFSTRTILARLLGKKNARAPHTSL